MSGAFEAIVRRLVGPTTDGRVLPLLDPEPLLTSGDDAAVACATFLLVLGGSRDPTNAPAGAAVQDGAGSPAGDIGRLLEHGVDLVRAEVAEAIEADPDLAATIDAVATRLQDPSVQATPVAEALWSLFFPQAVGILGREAEREAELRARRTVRILRSNPRPISDAAREILFTSNVLLTLPAASDPIDSLPYPDELIEHVATATAEPQRQWFDHPVQIGVEPAGNEILYGLEGLDAALAFEDHRRAAGDPIGTVPCVLSVTVTHDGLRRAARRYVEAELARSDDLRHLAVHVFTESETERLIDDVLVPAAAMAAEAATAATDGAETRDLLRTVFGVDGAYGRHYSFLKAIAAFWHVVVDPTVRGTFKIDLDQVFPQAELVAETGRSALEHLANPDWGAQALDAGGRPVDLGMLAGALVNERDIGAGLFSPDVPYPSEPPTLDEHVFFSRLPQALSTAAEMMERHGSSEREGARTTLERVHVTGGTNGLLVEALRRHRPFTPSFIGRAEDQAYVLSGLGRPGARLGYVHAAGLFMRHDKEAFAGEAIAAAHVGKLVGDYVRILEFTALANAVAATDNAVPTEDAAAIPGAGLDLAGIKGLLDPFTGSFISRLPVTVTLLRFALRLARFYRDGEDATAREFATVGAQRLARALERARDTARLRTEIDRERRGWGIYFDALDALEDGIRRGDPESLELRERGRLVVAACLVDPGRGAG